jgi:chitin disaccharide deacetylase
LTGIIERVARAGLVPGLIVNADDLGIHPSVNAGILSAYRSGILTSCTMLFTTPYLEETVRDCVRPGVLPIGIHLSLTLGKSAAGHDRVPHLADAEGNLALTARRLLTGSFADDRGRRLLDEIRIEFEAQLGLARDWGLRLSHADSHQHVHMNPAIFAIVEDLLPRHGVARVRFSREPLSLAAAASLAAPGRPANAAKWALLRWRSGQIRPRLATTDTFFGIVHSGATSRDALKLSLRAASPDKSVEICIHPGFCAPRDERAYPQPNYNAFISSPARLMEHDALTDGGVMELLRRRGLVLRAFDGRAKL